MFVGAGLSSAVSDLLNDEVLTFLRRADRHHLGSVSSRDVARAIREPVTDAGRMIGGERPDRDGRGYWRVSLPHPIGWSTNLAPASRNQGDHR